MKTQPLALTPAALAKAARNKTKKVQHKLEVAEAELHTANAVLIETLPSPAKKDLLSALKQNVAAEEKVREAADELQVVTELLNDGDADKSHLQKLIPKPRDAHNSKSGEGAHSVIPHLPKQAGDRPRA
jgi:hypothetical protein